MFENKTFIQLDYAKSDKAKTRCLSDCSVFSYESSSEEEIVLIHVEFASNLQDFDTHLEAEE